MVKVDCTSTEGKEACGTHGVRGYPTLMLFKNGAPTKYQGARSKNDLATWLTKEVCPTLLTNFNFHPFLTHHLCSRPPCFLKCRPTLQTGAASKSDL